MMIRKFILLFSALVLNSEVLADCSTYSSGWDWHGATYLVYDDDSTEASIPSPFSAGSSYGVDVSGQDMCYEDGWRLYSKKLTCDDFGADCSILAATDADYRPSIVLYNIHTAQLRFFIYTRDFERNDEELLVKVQVNHGGIDSESDLGILLNDSQPITVLSEKEDDYDRSDWNVFPSYKNKWIIFDKYLSYDPVESLEPNVRISLLFARRDTSDIYLAGDLIIETNYALDSGITSSNSVGVSDLYNIYKSYGDPGKWASDLEDEGTKLFDEGEASDSDIKKDAGNTLISMASFISSNAGFLGYANAAYSAYSTFFGGSTASSSSYQTMYSEGTMSIDGTIMEESPIEFLQYGVASSVQDQYSDESKIYESGYYGKVGLLSLSERPEIIIKSVIDPYDYDFFPGSGSNRYMTIDCPDGSGEECTFWFDVFQYSLLNTDQVEDLIVVNPDSGMSIKRIAIQPVLEVEGGYGWVDDSINSRDQGYYNPSYISVVNFSIKNSLVDCVKNGYDFAKCLDLSNSVVSESTNRWDESAEVEEISPKSMYDLSTRYLASPEGEMSHEYLGDSNGDLSGILTQRFNMGGSVSMRHGHSFRDIFLNVYVELENQANSNIKAEMKLRVPVSIGLCDGVEKLSPNLHLTGHEDDKYFSPSADQCKSMDHTIKDPVRRDQYGDTNRNPILANDNNANRYCFEEFGTYADSYVSLCAEDEVSYSTYSSSGWTRGESRNSCRTSFIDNVSCN
ncbi:MAG: hypothetical protein KYX62_08475 [Pseudomonadota bacterium]|nr:hypothetical protein [Pseudomonadota bacterium]